MIAGKDLKGLRMAHLPRPAFLTMNTAPVYCPYRLFCLCSQGITSSEGSDITVSVSQHGKSFKHNFFLRCKGIKGGFTSLWSWAPTCPGCGKILKVYSQDKEEQKCKDKTGRVQGGMAVDQKYKEGPGGLCSASGRHTRNQGQVMSQQLTQRETFSERGVHSQTSADLCHFSEEGFAADSALLEVHSTAKQACCCCAPTAFFFCTLLFLLQDTPYFLSL